MPKVKMNVNEFRRLIDYRKMKSELNDRELREFLWLKRKYNLLLESLSPQNYRIATMRYELNSWQTIAVEIYGSESKANTCRMRLFAHLGHDKR